MIKEIIFVTITKKKDNAGFGIDTRHEYKCIAEKKSVNREEFYRAMQAGVDAKSVFVVLAQEYYETKQEDEEGEHYAQKIICEGVEYDIVRIYEADNDEMEITVR